jgi:hypothetical protein
MLSASTRALAAELIRWVDDDGALYMRPAEQAWQAVARVIQAPRSDIAWVKRATSELVDDKHLVLETGRVVIRNFKVAQGIVESAEVISQQRSKEAERKARWRASRKNSGSAEADETGQETGHVPRDMTGHVPGDSGTGSCAPAPAYAREQAPAPAPPSSVPFRSVPFPSTTPRGGGLVAEVVAVMRTELGDRYDAIPSPHDLAVSLLNRLRSDAPDAPDRLDVIREAARDVAQARKVDNVESLLIHKAEKYDDPVVLARVQATRSASGGGDASVLRKGSVRF